MHADLVEVAPAFEAVHAPFDHEQRQPAVPFGRVGLRGDDHQVGVDAVGDERLGAVDDVLVAVAHRRGGDAGEVGSGAGLGHRDRRDQLARRDPGQPSVGLLVGAVLDEVRRGDVVVEGQAEAGAADARRGELLADDRVEPEVVRPAAAVLLGDRHPEEPVLPGREVQLTRGDAGCLPLQVVRCRLLGHERGEGLAERLVVVVEDRAHGATVGGRRKSSESVRGPDRYVVDMARMRAGDEATITFERLGREHFELLGRWLAEPHVARWWNHDPSPEAIEDNFGDTIDGIEPAEDYIALVDGQPLGVIQFCLFHDFPEYVAEMADVYPVDIDAATIDYFIGDPDAVGKGWGTAMIQQFVARIWREEPDVGHVVVPVNSANVASWKALLNAGFRLVARGELDPDNPDRRPPARDPAHRPPHGGGRVTGS